MQRPAATAAARHPYVLAAMALFAACILVETQIAAAAPVPLPAPTVLAPATGK